ncbi:hypothetical protein GCM10027280_50160 [Micromonospora polyrhachis]
MLAKDLDLSLARALGVGGYGQNTAGDEKGADEQGESAHGFSFPGKCAECCLPPVTIGSRRRGPGWPPVRQVGHIRSSEPGITRWISPVGMEPDSGAIPALPGSAR